MIMPRVYFGFNAESVPGEHVFVSYSRGDADRVKGIVYELHQMGESIWYDDGLIPGEKWETEIVSQVRQCKAAVFFLTKDLFMRDRAFVIEEYKYVKSHNKPKVFVWLDNIRDIDCQSLNEDMYVWWQELVELHGAEVYHMWSDKDKAKEIFYAVRRAVKEKENGKEITYPVPSDLARSANTPQIITVAAVVIAAIFVGMWMASWGGNGPIGGPTGTTSVPTGETNTTENTEPTTTGTTTASAASLSSVQVGDHITFGRYRQGSGGQMQDIEWRVLEVKNGEALIISEKLLDYVSYNDTLTDVTWRNCSLRQWMNNYFYNLAFSSNEQAQIANHYIDNWDNPNFGTDGGGSTEDKVFALSIDEAQKYFATDRERKAYTTDCAHNKGYDSDDNRTNWWWLRSPGNVGDHACSVNRNGTVHDYGHGVNFKSGAVRPALWKKL